MLEDLLLELLQIKRSPKCHQKSMRKFASKKANSFRSWCYEAERDEETSPLGGRRFGRNEEKKKGRRNGRKLGRERGLIGWSVDR